MLLGTGPPQPASSPPPTENNFSQLEQFLQHHLRVHSDRSSRLQCHVLTDRFVEADWAEEGLPSAFLSATEYLQTRHLILVSQNQSSSSVSSSPEGKKRPEGTVIVMGLCVVEYGFRERCTPSRSYIQYVDTTGLMRPRSLQGSLTKDLLKAYTCYARDVLKVSFLHLFASPRPSLLFAGSEVLGKKAVLGGKQLISWWLALLTETLSLSSSSSAAEITCSIFAYGPGEELLPASTRHTRTCIERLQESFQSPILNFHYGVPYRGDELAQDRIPAFQDDPKWRHLEALLESPHHRSNAGASRKRQKRDHKDSGLTVREFFQTLSYRSDFAKDHSALICACFHRPVGFEDSGQVQNKRTDVASCILSNLKMVTFESEAEAFKSSARILALVKIMGIFAFQISEGSLPEDEGHENVDPMLHSNRFKQIYHLLQPASHATVVVNGGAPVSDVQTLIKRKVPRTL